MDVIPRELEARDRRQRSLSQPSGLIVQDQTLDLRAHLFGYQTSQRHLGFLLWDSGLLLFLPLAEMALATTPGRHDTTWKRAVDEK
jgi:hypothetical protein